MSVSFIKYVGVFLLMVLSTATLSCIASEPAELKSFVASDIINLLVLDSASDEPLIPDPPDPALFQIDQLNYKGAFRFNSGRFGGNDSRYSVNYAVGALAYNPKNHSLFIAGHSQASRVAEFPIPTPGLQDKVSDLPISSPPLQNFTTVFPSDNDQEINRVTGMFWYDDALLINAEQWYNASGLNTDTTLVVDDADNLGGLITGFFALEGKANSAGYMGEIPLDHQGLFGGEKFYTGWSSVYSIVSRYSYGPSLWTFDPNELVNRDVTSSPNVNATAFMNFSYSSELRSAYDAIGPESAASPLWNILSSGRYGFFVPGTKTFAVIGSSGGVSSGIGYKITQTNGNLCGGYCSYDSTDNYNYFWLYNVDDIANASDVKDPRPYSYGRLNLPFDGEGAHKVIGGTLDMQTNTLYVAIANAGQMGRYDRPPLILTFSLDGDRQLLNNRVRTDQ